MPKVFILLDTAKQDIEINNDRLYHVNNLIETCNNEGIFSKVVYGRKLMPELSGFENEIDLDDQGSFAMIVQNKEGRIYIEKTFGTDIDLMLIIKNFFEAGINQNLKN